MKYFLLKNQQVFGIAKDEAAKNKFFEPNLVEKEVSDQLFDNFVKQKCYLTIDANNNITENSVTFGLEEGQFPCIKDYDTFKEIKDHWYAKIKIKVDNGSASTEESNFATALENFDVSADTFPTVKSFYELLQDNGITPIHPLEIS